MTDVEITPQADEHLANLEAEPRERILKKLAEARSGQTTGSNPCLAGPTTSSGQATTERSSPGAKTRTYSTSKLSGTVETSTIAMSPRSWTRDTGRAWWDQIVFDIE